MSEEQLEAENAQDPLIGATIGNYEVSKKIGEGGMGSVYLAVHPLIGKKVALKVLHAEFAANQDVVTRFFNEAKAVNDIQHPNIVDIIDYGVIPSSNSNDMVYFIMEHLDGYPLEDVIAEQAPLSPERSLHICAQVADALAASHNSNIVHRDLKPDNIILINKRNNSDFVKLLDFGIAKLTGDQPGSSKTRTGIVMGTPAYMSPEQCEGRGNIDNRTDVYALGVVMYQMITGRVPFEGEGYGEILVQHLTQAPIPPSTLRGVIPPHVEAICMKALEKSPAARFQSMEEFIAALTDPVGFVEANGGLQNFHTSNAHTIPGRGASYTTPAPGSLQGVAPAQTQYPSGIHTPASKSKAPIFIGLGAVAACAVAAAVFLGGGGGDEKEPEQTPEPAVQTATAVAPPKVDIVPEKPEVAPPVDEVKVVSVRLSVNSKPKGAELWGLDGYMAKTPNTFKDFQSDDLPMLLTLKKEGYEDLDFTWDFKEEQRKQRYNFPNLAMTKLPKSSSRRKKSDSSTKKPSEVTKSTPVVVKKPKVEPKPKKRPKNVGDNNMAPSF
jgi:serine/threonine-protein kinase